MFVEKAVVRKTVYPFRRWRVSALTASLLISLSACAPHNVPSASPPSSSAPAPALSPMAQLGQKLFFEASLSASGQQSCASCHSPAHGFGPPNDVAMQPGGADMRSVGSRTAPNLAYLSDTPPFSIGPDDPNDNDNDGDRSRGARHPTLLASVHPVTAKIANKAGGNEALVAQGGFFWDGRSNTLQQQALGPLLNPVEMANANPEEVAARLRKLPYIEQLKKLVDPHVLDDDRRLPSYAMFAISRYEMEDPAFHPYDSKYDTYLRGQVQLSAAEKRGLELFEDPKKGNCAACHPSQPAANGRLPLFTDYQYEALGVPRNSAIPANADPDAFDLGICGPARRDAYARQPQNCGLFKTPSLRNVARRHAFFHNGAFRTLDEVLRFYVERDIAPEKFYPRGKDGLVEKYNDLPPQYRGNIDVVDAPFDRKPGQTPALNEKEIQDVIAFLKTLNDGYR